MANVVVTASVIAKEALAILENELGVLKTMHRAHEDEFTEKVNGYNVGATINIRRPADFTIRTGATMSTQDILEGTVPLTIDQQKGVDFQLTSQEMTLQIPELSERVIKPAMSELINNIAQDVFSEMYKSTYDYLACTSTGFGTTPDNTKRIDSFNKFSCAAERMDMMAIPMAQRAAALHPQDNWGLVGSQTTLAAAGSLVTSAWTDGKLGNVGGLETYMSQVLPTHTVGPLGGTPLVNGANQNVAYSAILATAGSWSQNLITNGWTAAAASRLLRGDCFTLAGVFKVNPKTKATTSVLQTFVVLADVSSDGSGNLTASISPPIITSGPHQTVSAAPASGAALTVIGSANALFRQNLAYHKTAMALAFVPLVLPPGAVNPARESYKNMSVRVIPVYVGSTDLNQWRLDVLYGRKLIDPRKVARFTSG